MHAARSASVEIVGVKIAETRTYWKLPWSVIDRIDYNNKLMKNACIRRVSAATILTSMHNNHTHLYIWPRSCQRWATSRRT